MSASRNIRVIENTLERNGGLVWNRLHSEREEICEALLKESVPGSGTEAATQRMSKEDAVRIANWHKALLQARLRKIDDALDRLLSGSYGHCSKCGRWIEDTKLDFDPAIAFCIDCWQREQSRSNPDGSIGGNSQPPMKVISQGDGLKYLNQIDPSLGGLALETLAPFDTISVQTRNSDYRISLLDPRTGHALVKGGRHFVEPVEAMVNGSSVGGPTLKGGWIGIGLRIEMWVKDKLVSTSPVQSVRVEHHTPA